MRSRGDVMDVRKSGVVARAAVVAQLLEVLAGLVGAAEEDLAALVQDDDLVEEVVGALGRLVDGDDSRAAEEARLHAQRLAELDGIGAVEAARAVIPALQRAAAQ